MAAEFRAALAIARKQLRVISRYRLDLASIAFIPLVQFLIPSLLLGSTFLVAGRAVGMQASTGSSDVAGFLFLGAATSSFSFGAFWAVSFSFRVEMMQGTLEPTWLTPTRRTTMVLGYAISSFIVSALGGIGLIAVGAFFFDARYLSSGLAVLPALLLSMVALIGIAYLMSAAVLMVKEPNFLIDTTSFLFSAMSGVMFPVTVLPGVVKVIPFLLPATYALDLLRVGTLHTRPLLPPVWEYAALSALTVVLVPLGVWVFTRTERRLSRLGTLGQY
jgi:ABC-2 type transport system permease protein